MLHGTLSNKYSVGHAEILTKISMLKNIFYIQNKAFLDAVVQGSTSGIHSSYEDGMKTLATTLAANESARNQNGSPVRVAF